MGIRLAQGIYSLASQLPDGERFGLTQQMCRAAVSLPSNIAEGHARGATREFSRYVAMAQGSLAELETQIELCRILGFCPEQSTEALLLECAELSRALTGLRKALDNKLAPARIRAP